MTTAEVIEVENDGLPVVYAEWLEAGDDAQQSSFMGIMMYNP